MSVNSLTELVSVKRELRVSDGMGGDTVTLIDVATDVWAFVKPVKGSERAAHDSIEAQAFYRFKIRNRNDIKASDRIVWNSETFNIRAVLTTGNRAMYLEIDAERGVSQ